MYNLLNVDSLINTFLEKHYQGIYTMHNLYFKTSNELSLKALIAELEVELRTGCTTYLNKEDSEISGLDSYLFYITNAYAKKRAAPHIKRKTEYICPGCLFLNKENLVTLTNKFFTCDDCDSGLRTVTDPKLLSLFRTFFKHNKLGYHCNDCDRFIPHPVDESPVVSCPYLDCSFVGSWSSLKRMHHPSSSNNIELLTLDAPIIGTLSIKNNIPSSDADALSKLEMKEIIDNQIKMLRDVIDYQKNNVPYSSSDFTVHHKYLCYDAFSNILKKYPVELIDYLLNKSRSGGFQHKIFQEYSKLLENSLPFHFKRNNKQFKIESLLDDNLKIFDGISVFETIVNEKIEVKNATKEFYVGGRKGSIAQPYYIGKLLSVTDKLTKNPLLDKVTEYSFSKIKMKDIDPGTEVIVTHLRIPPHYQMGGMVYINRVRKKIIDRVHFLQNKNE
jgi:hypothetical protein